MFLEVVLYTNANIAASINLYFDTRINKDPNRQHTFATNMHSNVYFLFSALNRSLVVAVIQESPRHCISNVPLWVNKEIPNFFRLVSVAMDGVRNRTQHFCTLRNSYLTAATLLSSR